jgi:hypothetical protein
VEPFVFHGVLWLSMLWRSTKAADLRRDPRILVHDVITSRDGGEGQFKVRGRARRCRWGRRRIERRRQQ